MAPEIIILPALFGLVGFLLWIALTSWERRQHLRRTNDFYTRLFDRMGSLKDFGDFIQTAHGAELMKALTTQPMDAPMNRILRAIQMGVVLLSLSVGLFAVGRVVLFDAPEPRQLLDALAVIVLSLGVGSLASALVAHVMAPRVGADRL
jgi:hypothetical protein